MILLFELTMPNRGSWNGQWSGQSKRYFKHRIVSKKKADELAPLNGNSHRNFYYDFGDGWGANVAVKQVTSKEKRSQEKVSAGFCGYDWMIDSILLHGEILNSIQRIEKEILESKQRKVEAHIKGFETMPLKTQQALTEMVKCVAQNADKILDQK